VITATDDIYMCLCVFVCVCVCVCVYLCVGAVTETLRYEANRNKGVIGENVKIFIKFELSECIRVANPCHIRIQKKFSLKQ
jgi:hypothetical protein